VRCYQQLLDGGLVSVIKPFSDMPEWKHIKAINQHKNVIFNETGDSHTIVQQNKTCENDLSPKLFNSQSRI